MNLTLCNTSETKTMGVKEANGHDTIRTARVVVGGGKGKLTPTAAEFSPSVP